MRQSIKTVLRFLFPELQIIDAVKQDGFIAKKTSAKNMHTANKAVAGNAVVQQRVEGSTASPPLLRKQSEYLRPKQIPCRPLFL